VISRRFSPWQKLVALAPLLLVAVYLPGEMMVRCRFDGLLRPARCCPQASEESGDAQDLAPVVKAQDCCHSELSASERPVVEATQRTDPGSVTWAWAATPAAAPVSDASPPRPGAWAAQRYGPVRVAPPIVLAKHAFLI